MQCLINKGFCLHLLINFLSHLRHFTLSCHTFGTMMLTLGADLFTTSKLMGHTNVQTTEIYAKIVDKKKEEAINLIDGMFK